VKRTLLRLGGVESHPLRSPCLPRRGGSRDHDSVPHDVPVTQRRRSGRPRFSENPRALGRVSLGDFAEPSEAPVTQRRRSGCSRFSENPPALESRAVCAVLRRAPQRPVTARRRAPLFRAAKRQRMQGETNPSAAWGSRARRTTHPLPWPVPVSPRIHER
jgi:hypothetical protein